ncbi:translation initiation factor 2 gamma subunit [Corchorus olitorius]|uniref:Translation initiation factor 2 gamma subunit n=1 Tax=Corchorus olitorius TaxID=93759 RepID=A0A1R3J732_9ROSI|nr:translation initiation factor 2 gamma subunit [Corchorus olitorius]
MSRPSGCPPFERLPHVVKGVVNKLVEALAIPYGECSMADSVVCRSDPYVGQIVKLILAMPLIYTQLDSKTRRIIQRWLGKGEGTKTQATMSRIKCGSVESRWVPLGPFRHLAFVWFEVFEGGRVRGMKAQAIMSRISCGSTESRWVPLGSKVIRAKENSGVKGNHT